MPVFMEEEEVIRRNMELANERYTTEFVEQLPDGVRAELIDGRMFYMATPSTIHQGLLMFLTGNVWSYINKKGGECQVYPAPLAVYLNQDNQTYLEPDAIILCDKEKMKKNGCYGAPDFVAEIISPSTKSRDYILKMMKYQAAGVREYWILDPEKRTILVYDFECDEINIYGFQDKVSVRILDDLEINFAEFQIPVQ